MTTLTLGEFRKRTEHLNDNTEIIAHAGDLEFYDTRIDYILPPIGPSYAAVVSLVQGEVVNFELDMDTRLDINDGI